MQRKGEVLNKVIIFHEVNPHMCFIYSNVLIGSRPSVLEDGVGANPTPIIIKMIIKIQNTIFVHMDISQNFNNFATAWI